MKICNCKISLKIIMLFSISLIGFYFLNLYTNLALDDFFYKYILNIKRGEGIRVESISDLITSQYNHYFIQNGRLLLNGLAQVFLMSENKLWFNIVNTLLFGFFQILILKRSTSLNNTSGYQYLLLIIFLWFLIPSPSFTLLWLTGSMNYMWAMIIVLLFLNILDRINLKNLQIKNKYLPLILVFGFLAGFTHEVISVSIAGALCIGLLKKFKKYKISSLILIFGFLLGTLVLVIAPGNMIRFNDSSVNKSIENYTDIYLILRRLGEFISYSTYFSAFWLMIGIFIVLYVKDRSGLKKIYREHELLLHSILISLVFILLVGAYSTPRSYFGISVFSIIIVLSILHKYSALFFNKKNKIIYVILFVFVLIEFTQVVVELRANKIVFDKGEENLFNSDDKVFVIDEKYDNRFTLPQPGRKSDRHRRNNRDMSWYYGKEFMIFISSDLYHNVYKSNKFLSAENLLNTESLRNSSEGIKLYKTPKNNFLIYEVSDSISKNILEGAHVNYKSNKLLKFNNSDYVYRIKRLLGANYSINSERATCFVLPTTYGNYLVLRSPLKIPFENLEEIIIYPNSDDTTPILSF
jgi:hypothetical protein